MKTCTEKVQKSSILQPHAPSVTDCGCSSHPTKGHPHEVSHCRSCPFRSAPVSRFVSLGVRSGFSRCPTPRPLFRCPAGQRAHGQSDFTKIEKRCRNGALLVQFSATLPQSLWPRPFLGCLPGGCPVGNSTAKPRTAFHPIAKGRPKA